MQSGLAVKATRVAIVVALFAIWEILSRTGLVNPRLLPSASDTLATLGDLLQRASVRKDLAVTARSPRTLARCESSASVASVSDADGSSRGLTMAVRDSISQIAKIATTIPSRAILIPRRVIPRLVAIIGCFSAWSGAA